jgi:hypothetical protein
MNRYVLIDSTGLVVNAIMWDGDDDWSSDEYTAMQSDTASIGWRYSNGEFIKPSSEITALTDEQLASAARAKRDILITETDYLLMSDYPIETEKLALVKTYRQLLRDITKQSGFPVAIDWPPIPE